jgi:nitrogen fixation NifU-like protein
VSGGLYDSGIKELAANCPVPERLPEPDRRISLDNPFCGDRVDIEVRLEGGRVEELASLVRGCMLCQASTNLLAASAVGLSEEEIAQVLEQLRAMLKGNEAEGWPPAGWEQLELFEAVSRHKHRHGCVTLPFTALLEAMSG